MNKIFLLAVGGVITAGLSSAATVDYSTAATFDCNGISNCAGTGTNTATITVGQNSVLNISFVGNTDTVNTPSNTNYGALSLSCQNCNNSAFTLDGLLLNISLSQGPNPFTQVMTPLSQGTFNSFLIVTGNTQTGLPTVSFSPTSPALVLGPNGGTTVTYTIDSPVRPSVTNAVNVTGTVQAVVQETGTPEPGTVGLIGLGLAGLGLVARRRK